MMGIRHRWMEEIRDGLDRALSQDQMRLAAVLLLFSVLAFSKLGEMGLAAWDDGYYAQKAREIFSSGDWLTMHYNGRPTFDNPPLFMWLQAAAYRLFGVGEYAARLPSAILGTLTIWLVFCLGRELRDARYGLMSALVLALTKPFIRYSRRGMMDVSLSFFVVVALFFGWKGAREDRRWFLLWALACGAAVLEKSVLGMFPFLIVILWLVVQRNWESLRSPQFVGAVVLFAIAGGWWYVYQIIQWGDRFVHLHFGWLILARGFSRQEGAGNWWEHLSYLKDLLKYYWPWLPLALWGLAVSIREYLTDRKLADRSLLLVWLLSYLLVLSFMEARRIWYFMPAFPVLALLAAGPAVGWMKLDVWHTRLYRSVLVLSLAAGAAINFTPLRIDKERSLEVRRVAPYVRYYHRLGAGIIGYRLDYHGLNNLLLFYSGVGADIRREPAQLEEVLAQGGEVGLLVERDEYQRLDQGIRSSFKLVKGSGPLLFLTSGSLRPDTIQIKVRAR